MANNINCDPNILAELARCFKCLSFTTNLEVQTYLLCQIVNTIGTGGGGAVTQIIAGTNVTVSPVGGTGAVTISASGSANLTSGNWGGGTPSYTPTNSVEISFDTSNGSQNNWWGGAWH